MAFNYDKNKVSHSNDSFWTSYSDLFLGLSTIFLMLYVVSSLRTGTDALQGQVQNQKLTMQVEELKHQLKMYENVKNEYMKNEASKDEVQEYQELMDKLTLLQEDTKNEKDRLVKEAFENENKVKALNKYQQMVRNVMNANKMAKAKLDNRNDLIKEQDTEITTQETQIYKLQKDIDTKKQLIAQGERQIMQTQEALDEHEKELREAYNANKINKKNFEKKLNQLRDQADQKVASLNNANAQYQNQLQQANSKLNQTQGELQKTQSDLAQKEGALQSMKGKLGEAQNQLGAAQNQLSDTKGQLANSQGKLASMAGQLNSAKGALSDAKGKLADAQGKLASTEGALSATQGQLAKAKAEIEARKAVADEIKKGFAKAGVKAEIDGQTGDVVLDFGQAYFENGSDRLKQEMKGVLEKAMPIYSKSLFGNPKVSDKISAVEVIGFASPTYQGRFIDPSSSKPEDKEALKYNMDLSYRRANAIFSYMLDDGNLKFDHQRDLLARMKVSGRSFLEVMKVQNRNVATAAEFCKQNDCKKAQRVIIRFSMDQKK
ncbi:MAG TPA: hypothetical protein VN132_14540 [Bdellovibrio sp.]|nr:hypothetical protein [Bdellovibrio sp.]